MLGDLDDLGCSAESESKIKLSATLLRPVWIELSPERGGSFASRHIFAASLVNGGKSASLCVRSRGVEDEEDVAGEGGGRDETMREYWAGVISATEGSSCIGCGGERRGGGGEADIPGYISGRAGRGAWSRRRGANRGL